MKGYLATWVEMHILHCIEVKAMPIASNPGDAALLSLPTDLLRIILSELSVADLGHVSIACKRLRSLALEPQYWEHRDERKRKAVRLEAIYDFVATTEDEVDVCVGEDVTILEEMDDHGWYKIRNVRIWKTHTTPHHMFVHIAVQRQGRDVPICIRVGQGQYALSSVLCSLIYILQ